MAPEKKRVLYFVPEFPRISETFIEREISHLVERNSFDLKILSLSKASGSTSEAVRERTVYKRLGIAEFLSGLGYLIISPRETAACFKLITNLKGGNILSKVYFFLKSLGYTKVISGFEPHHIHVHFLSWPSTTVMIAARLLKVPFSISAHARDVFVEGEMIPDKVRSAKFISICNSYAYKKALEIAGNGTDATKVKLIYHGIDPDIFSGPAKMEKWDVPAIFLGGTRLVEKKGIKYVIEASRILKDEGIRHRLDLVGPGDLYAELENMISSMDLKDTVFIHGQGKGTPFKEVLEFYKVADIFVFPGIETATGDADGVPTVVIEASMAKLPIISTNAGGITDLVQDGVTGLIVEQRSAGAIAQTIKKLLSEKELASRLSENAYSKAVEMFDISKNVGQLESLMK